MPRWSAFIAKPTWPNFPPALWRSKHAGEPARHAGEHQIHNMQKGLYRQREAPKSYTEPLKKKDIALYGLADTQLKAYELDHLIPLEVGGNPTDPQNLWPEPYAGEWGARTKDQIENKINALVCNGQISLAAGQDAFITNWIEAYQKYISPTPIDSGGTSSSSGD